MPKIQENIYYLTGESLGTVQDLPFLEVVKKKSFKVLLIVDDIKKYAQPQPKVPPHLRLKHQKILHVWSTMKSLSLNPKKFLVAFLTNTAGINRSNTAARAVLEQPCSTGGRTETVRPKREPTGRTDLSDRSRLVLCNRSQELIGQACPTRRQVLRSDSACPTTGRTRLFKHRSNCRVRPVNAGSETNIPK
ncbi:hypothetical protein PCASD_18430 [Puccinia coronata f. sp. avenae]|uniref:Uncharacterized protein n=1 Tax=Puccinia coronata f. sp. avenae TaxID=200324 RepID=A0A2N5TZ52_9BASI|nr:hypothetical protein PCASD_18430 [Puccinia coronata f. sp. avenae]